MKDIVNTIYEARGVSIITKELLAGLGIEPSEYKQISKTIDMMFKKVNALTGKEDDPNNKYNPNQEDVGNESLIDDFLYSITESKADANALRDLFGKLIRSKKGGNIKAKVTLLILSYKALQKLNPKIKPDAVRALVSGYDMFIKQ